MKFVNVLFFIFILGVGVAQVQHQGSPASLKQLDMVQEVPVIQTPFTNLQALKQEDEVVDLIKDIPWRYGYIHYVDVGMQQGTYKLLPNGDRIWRLKVKSEGAQTINLTFDLYNLASGAQMFVYNENYKNILGSFTHENNKEHGFLTTTLLQGDAITIELFEPQAVMGQSVLHLQRVIHGYRALDYQNKDIGDSGNCNNNVVCSAGDNWRDQIRSVGILLSQNNLSAGFCTGALINNTCNDGKAYFLTANHCGADEPTTVVGFNFESTSCNTNTGPYLMNTISGVTRRSSNAGSDFMLLELSSDPPSSYNVFFSGWDRTGSITVGQVGIHHPSGDLKKISFDSQAPTFGNYSGAQCWRIGNWEDGTTEGGSSGSPLFNLDGNIIGQLFGGSASCMSITEDFYGRFDISWDNGSAPGDELKTWLDPCNTNLTALPGYDPNAILLNEDAALNFSGRPNAAICANKVEQKLTLRNRGTQVLTSAQIQYGIVGSLNTYNWTGNLSSNETALIVLEDLTPGTGSFDYEAFITNTNLTIDENSLNDAVAFLLDITNGVGVTVNFTTNFAAAENILEIRDGNNDLIDFAGNFDNFDSYNFSYCLQTGSYCVNFIDEGGDGLTPTFFFDRGNYQLLVDGVEIINDDAIGSGFEYCFTVGQPTSISGDKEIILFDLFPNPNTGNFVISAAEDIKKFEMFNLLGELVKTNEVLSKQVNIQTRELAKGVYFVKIYTSSGTGMKKMLLK